MRRAEMGFEHMKSDSPINKLGDSSLNKKSFVLSVESDSKGIAVNLWIAHRWKIWIAKFIIGIILVPIVIHFFQTYFINYFLIIY
jgi:hypothetical protein